MEGYFVGAARHKEQNQAACFLVCTYIEFRILEPI